MKQSIKYNTNLASEFYVMSVLYRLGIDAHLTLGNKKSVDILIVKEDKQYITVDVKGVRSKTGWLLGNHLPLSHFVILVSYMDVIGDVKQIPECYIIPSAIIKSIAKYFPKKGWGIYKNPIYDTTITTIS